MNAGQATITEEEEKAISGAIESAIDTLDGKAVGVVIHVFWKGDPNNGSRTVCSTGIGLAVDPSTEEGAAVVLSMMADVPRLAKEWAGRMSAKLGLVE